jgi:hypothetical protein
MNDIFPSVSTVSINDTEAGSIVKIPRSDNPILALVTDHLTEGSRSVVWLNAKIPQRPSIMFAENWRHEKTTLRYNDNIRFELGIADNEVDPRGSKSWETHGVIVSIGDELYIRAAPQDNFYGHYRLINIRNGSVFEGHPPNDTWSFLKWKLCLRDSIANHDVVLMEFDSRAKQA